MSYVMELECKLLLFIYMYYFKKSILLITGVGNFMPSIYTFIYKMPVIAITMKISAKLPVVLLVLLFQKEN